MQTAAQQDLCWNGFGPNSDSLAVSSVEESSTKCWLDGWPEGTLFNVPEGPYPDPWLYGGTEGGFGEWLELRPDAVYGPIPAVSATAEEETRLCDSESLLLLKICRCILVRAHPLYLWTGWVSIRGSSFTAPPLAHRNDSPA